MTQNQKKRDADYSPRMSPRTDNDASPPLHRRMRNWLRDESGTMMVELAITAPLLFLLFFITVEFSYLKVRQISLDHVTDVTFRELRLGLIPDADHDTVKAEICDKALAQLLLWDCSDNLLLEVREVAKSDWSINAADPICLDTTPEEDYEPPIVFTTGIENQMMIARTCLIQRSLFPPMQMLMSIPRYDDLGNFAVVSKSAFVNEPS